MMIASRRAMRALRSRIGVAVIFTYEADHGLVLRDAVNDPRISNSRGLPPSLLGARSLAHRACLIEECPEFRGGLASKHTHPFVSGIRSAAVDLDLLLQSLNLELSVAPGQLQMVERLQVLDNDAVLQLGLLG
ncbi:hypothetical protein J2X36_000741 [Methylobacterium sp. BE186]|nr:hypothetical protein [Methylobacterium sp. BE186]MDR7036005.1 hypothetical protein [Methylobacterium sp. BE186]